MNQRQRIVIAQQQRLALNANLHASIRLLRSDTAGLTRYLEEQAAENPYLRLIPPEPAALGDWLPRWTSVLGFGSHPATYGETATTAQPSLIAHVTAAIQAMALASAALPIALALVEALEPSGWLGRDPAVIASELGLAADEVLAVLNRLQTIDPAGLFARNLAECLALQIGERGQLDHEMKVILDNLDLLAAGETRRLARLCGCDETGIASRFRIIRTLNPKPGAGFSGPNPAHSREPDLLARLLTDGGWQVGLNRSALPALEVVTEIGAPASADAERLKSARALRHMLSARNDTLLKVGQEIVRRQTRALAQGPGVLQPMTMADVAAALGLHVSTVSRVVAGASMDSPHGVWWLRRMFSGARGGPANGEAEGETDAPRASAAALRHRLGRIVAVEAPEAPLSDASLATQLAQETGVTLARRTVAQYREAEGIPPAHRRRRVAKFRARPKTPPNAAT